MLDDDCWLLTAARVSFLATEPDGFSNLLGLPPLDPLCTACADLMRALCNSSAQRVTHILRPSCATLPLLRSAAKMRRNSRQWQQQRKANSGSSISIDPSGAA
jgi:hypothetical protein